MRLWEEAKFCPLCGSARPGGAAERLDPRDLRITELESELKSLRRELQRERDLTETLRQELNAARREMESQVREFEKERADLETRLACRDSDVERLKSEVARLRRFGAHWPWPMAAGFLAGLAVSGVAIELWRPDPGLPFASFTLTQSWTRLPLPEDRRLQMTADAAFRLRVPGGLYVVEPGEAVALPPGGPLEARAVAEEVTLTVSSSP